MIANNIKTIDVRTVDWRGKAINLRGVPAIKHPKINKVVISIGDLLRAEIREIADRVGIEERDIPLFLLLYAKPGPFQRGFLCQKYKINKMLFYLWKELEKEGLDAALQHDEFKKARRGPVPKNLWNDLKRLHEEGLIKVEGGKKVPKTVEVELTVSGAAIAKDLWDSMPDPYLVVTSRVKDMLFPLEPETIKNKVHKDYPKYRKTYIVADREQKIKF